MTKTKTCPRCNGTGLTNHAVVHGGIPGGCYQCDTRGVLVWKTVEELNAVVDAGIRSYLIEIEQRAADQKADFEALSPERKAKYAQKLENSLAELRALWCQVKRGEHPLFTHAKRGKWCAK